jgi:hypothetical protein
VVGSATDGWSFLEESLGTRNRSIDVKPQTTNLKPPLASQPDLVVLRIQAARQRLQQTSEFVHLLSSRTYVDGR